MALIEWRGFRRHSPNKNRFIPSHEKLPSPQSEIFFGALGGATTRPAPDSVAYAHRDTMFVMNFHGRWEDPADDERFIRWACDFFNASAPFASGGVYVNFLTSDEDARVRAVYGPNYDRLAQVKHKYDPGNLFRMNQNIKPAGKKVSPKQCRGEVFHPSELQRFGKNEAKGLDFMDGAVAYERYDNRARQAVSDAHCAQWPSTWHLEAL